LRGELASKARQWAASPYAWLGVAYVLIRLATAHWRPITPGVDTGAYKAIASLNPWDPDFFTGSKPWGAPLVWKLLITDRLRVAGHHFISVAAWLLLATAVARCVTVPRVRVAAFALVLLFSLAGQVTLWDSLLLSESLAVSTFALVVAAWLALARDPSWKWVGLVLGATVFWVAMRDTNAWAALLGLPAVVVWLVKGNRRALPAALVIGTVAIAGASVALARHANRDEVPTLHVLGHRVIDEPGGLEYMRSHGMPDWQAMRKKRPISELDGLAGRMLHGPCSPQCRAFHDWLEEKGGSTYLGYLVTHPVYAIGEPIKQIHSWIASDFKSGGNAGWRRVALPDPLPALLWPGHATQIAFWLVLVGLGAIAVALRRGVPLLWAVPATLVVTALPHGMLTWLGDENPGRHGLTAAVQARLALIILGVFVVDTALRARDSRPAATPSA
jgi:hypothetical protein